MGFDYDEGLSEKVAYKLNASWEVASAAELTNGCLPLCMQIFLCVSLAPILPLLSSFPHSPVVFSVSCCQTELIYPTESCP